MYTIHKVDRSFCSRDREKEREKDVFVVVLFDKTAINKIRFAFVYIFHASFHRAGYMRYSKVTHSSRILWSY